VPKYTSDQLKKKLNNLQKNKLKYVSIIGNFENRFNKLILIYSDENKMSNNFFKRTRADFYASTAFFHNRWTKIEKTIFKKNIMVAPSEN